MCHLVGGDVWVGVAHSWLSVVDRVIPTRPPVAASAHSVVGRLCSRSDRIESNTMPPHPMTRAPTVTDAADLLHVVTSTRLSQRLTCDVSMPPGRSMMGVLLVLM